MSDRQIAVSNVALTKEIAKVVGIKQEAAHEVLKRFGTMAAELIADGKSVYIPEVGTIKPCTLAKRDYHNPRGGEAIKKDDRKSARLEVGSLLKKRLGR